MIEIVKTYPVMLCLYKRLEFTEHFRRGWKGWKIITILSNNRAKRLGKHHQFYIYWLVFVFHCSDNPVRTSEIFVSEIQKGLTFLETSLSFRNIISNLFSSSEVDRI